MKSFVTDIVTLVAVWYKTYETRLNKKPVPQLTIVETDLRSERLAALLSTLRDCVDSRVGFIRFC